MTKEESKALYAGKHFYKIIKNSADDTIILVGPLDNIYYAKPLGATFDEQESHFVQVIEGKPVSLFKKEEILVTNRVL